jgi:hypothetical protein
MLEGLPAMLYSVSQYAKPFSFESIVTSAKLFIVFALISGGNSPTPGRCVSIEPGIHRAAPLFKEMDSE